jgi:hypothetical protein
VRSIDFGGFVRRAQQASHDAFSWRRHDHEHQREDREGPDEGIANRCC